MADITVLGTQEMPWPDKKEGPWTLRIAFGIVGDRPGVVGVELYAVDPREIKKAAKGWPEISHPPGRWRWKTAGLSAEEIADLPEGEPLREIVGYEAITTTGIRIPLAELTAQYLARAERSDRIVSHAPSFPPDWQKAAADRLHLLEGVLGDHRGPGRPSIYDHKHFERVAEVYADALRAGKSPTEAVRGILPGTSKSAATKWVAKARELGLLPGTVKGKAAGWPVEAKKRRSKRQ